MRNVREVLQTFINLWSAGHLRDFTGNILPKDLIDGAREALNAPHAYLLDGEYFIDAPTQQELESDLKEWCNGYGQTVSVETWYRGELRYADVDKNGKVTFRKG